VSWGKKAAKVKCCHRIIHQGQSSDYHPKIAFAAVRTVAVIEHMLLDLLLYAEERIDLVR
jgi:hypothetical protein